MVLNEKTEEILRQTLGLEKPDDIWDMEFANPSEEEYDLTKIERYKLLGRGSVRLVENKMRDPSEQRRRLDQLANLPD